MLENSKKSVKNARIRTIALMAIAAISLVVWLVFQLAAPDSLGFAPIWMLFLVFFLGCGVFYLAYGLIKKRTLMNVAGGTSLIIGLILLSAVVFAIRWWIILIGALVLFVILFISTIFTKAPQLKVEFDNSEGAGHKTYEQRKKEQEALPKKEEEMPEIKSFKD